MGCKCEPGYSGPTCESKMCKHGLDPLYIDDDYMTIRAPTARVLLQYVNTTDSRADGAASAEARDDLVKADAGVDVNSRNKVEYDLTFTENLGDLKPIEINANLDGTRPSVYAIGHQGADNKVKFDVDVKVLANAEGISGENIDYFPTMCDGVTLQATAGVDAAAVKLLKACLGDADGDASNNLEVYNWDYGLTNTTWHPHVVKLTKTPTARTTAGVTDDYDAGKYYLT